MYKAREEYEAAFEAWKAATKKYWDAMQAILDGTPPTNLEIVNLIEEMERSKQKLCDAAKPFIHGF